MKLKKLLFFIDTINELIGKIFLWILPIVTSLVVLEVFMRKVLNEPTIWSFEVTLNLYGFYFMILAGYGLLHKSHVSVDLLYSFLSDRKKAILDTIGYIIFFFPFVIIIFYEGFKFAAASWTIRECSWTTFSCPLYPLKTVIPLMAALLLMQGIANFFRTIYKAIWDKDL